MSWAAIIAVIIQVLGPLLKEWLERLLNQAAARLDGKDLPPSIIDPVEGMRLVFAEARSQLWWYQWARHRALSRAESAMMRHADQTWVAAAAGPDGKVPTLSLSEAAAIGQLPD